MINFGSVPAGAVLPIVFDSYAGATGASVTLTGLAITDVEVYKGISMTQRASDAGVVLMDTDGIDLDGVTGIHGFSIDTGDNTDAGFYAVGSFFTVVVSAVTIDAQTVNFVAATFRIVAAEAIAGKPKADVDAWLGTAAATPTVNGVPEVDLTHVAGSTTSVSTLASSMATLLADWLNGGRLDLILDIIAADTTTDIPALIAALNNLSAAAAAAAVWNEDATGHQTTGTFGQAIGDPVADTNSIYKAVVTDATNATVGLDVGASRVFIDSIYSLIDTEVGAIKGKTDQLIFTGAGRVDANVAAANNSTVGINKLSAHLPAILMAVVAAGSTTTAVVLNATTGIDGAAPSSIDDFYNGAVIVFTSGALAGQRTAITDYVGATQTLTVVALTGAPAAAVTAVIV